MQQALCRALTPTPHTTNQGSCAAGSGRLGARGATGRLGRGFGPWLVPVPRRRKAQTSAAGGRGGGSRGPACTAATGHSSVPIVSQATDQQQQQQQKTTLAQPGDGDLGGGISEIAGGSAAPEEPLPAAPASAGAVPPASQDSSSSSEPLPESAADSSSSSSSSSSSAADGSADGGIDSSGGDMHGQQHYRQQGLPSSRSDTMLLQSAEQQRYGLLGGLSSGLGRSVSASVGGGDRRISGSGAPGMPATAAASAGQQEPPGQAEAGNSIPVYVMLPLDTVNSDGVFRYASSKWFSSALQRLAATGIRGVAVDVWWGAVERRPRRYDWSGYRQLFALVRALGLKLQVVMSFHACGGNVGDNAQIPLPQWVLQAGESDPDIFFTDRPRELFPGQRNRECLSFFADEEPGLLRGRSPMQCYVEFMRAFRDEFLLDLGSSSLIEEVVVGCGPCGELRYPSYPEANGWRFPGVGEFQCYDRRALASLAAAAREAGHPEWGNTGPHDVGSYNSAPEETGFFCSWGGNWETAYGRFFLEWYSGALLDHGERMLTAATSVFNTRRTARERSWPAVIGGGRSRSLPDLPASGGSRQQQQQQHHSPLPPLPAGAEDAAGAQQQQQPADQAQQQQEQEEAALLYNSGGAFDAGLVDSYRLQQQQQAAALRTSPSVDMLPAAGLPPPSPSPVGVQGLGIPPAGDPGSAPPLGGLPAANSGGLGMRHHASYSSLRSSVSAAAESEEWMGDGGAGCAPSGPAVELTMKVAGVHWWFRTRSHAAELTAGYFNTDQRDGYSAILQLCARHDAGLTLTCVEMCDAQHPPEALCGPEGLLRQVRERAAAVGVSVAGENALPCFMPNIIDETALHRIVYNTQPWGTPLQTGAGASGLDPAGPVATAAAAAAAAAAGAPLAVGPGPGAAINGSGSVAAAAGAAATPGSSSGLGSPGSSNGNDSPSSTASGELQAAKLPPMRAFTFLRLTDMMMSEDYQRSWGKFTRMMSQNAQRFRTSASWRRGMGFE